MNKWDELYEEIVRKEGGPTDPREWFALGYDNGYVDGRGAGYEEGYDEGYDEGRYDCDCPE
jgi:flagellar biosynthesis/type III secretory pathway protein FliH